MTSTFHDLNGIDTVIDDDLSDTLIADTTKPSDPQYTRTILSGDFPSSSDVVDYEALFSIGGKNTSAANQTIHWRFTLNGTDIGAGDNQVTIGAGQYWYTNGVFEANALAANDVLGVKLWVGNASVVDYRYATIYVIPRVFAIPTTDQLGLYWGKTTGVLSGAITGVTYVTRDANGQCFYDPSLSGVQSQQPIGGTIPIAMIGYPQQFVQRNSLADENSLGANTTSNPSLMRVGSLHRYFRTFAP